MYLFRNKFNASGLQDDHKFQNLWFTIQLCRLQRAILISCDYRKPRRIETPSSIQFPKRRRPNEHSSSSPCEVSRNENVEQKKGGKKNRWVKTHFTKRINKGKKRRKNRYAVFLFSLFLSTRCAKNFLSLSLC